MIHVSYNNLLKKILIENSPNYKEDIELLYKELLTLNGEIKD